MLEAPNGMKPLETGMKCKVVVSAHDQLMLEGPRNNLLGLTSFGFSPPHT